MEIASRDFTSPRTPRGRFISPFIPYPDLKSAFGTLLGKNLKNIFYKLWDAVAIIRKIDKTRCYATFFAITGKPRPMPSMAFFDAAPSKPGQTKKGIF